MASRRAEPIESGGIVRPLGIAEIGQASRERVRCHRLPDGIRQVCAGFHYDGLSAGPRDIEAKLICLHTEAISVRLHLR